MIQVLISIFCPSSWRLETMRKMDFDVSREVETILLYHTQIYWFVFGFQKWHCKKWKSWFSINRVVSFIHAVYNKGGPSSRRPRPKTDYQPQLRYAQRHQRRDWQHMQHRKDDAFRDARLNPPLRRAGVAFNAKNFNTGNKPAGYSSSSSAASNAHTVGPFMRS